MLDPVCLAQALIRRPSVTPNDEGAIGVLQDALRPLGFACHRLPFEDDGAPRTENLYAQVGSAGPVFCFAGHTDVVPPGDAGLWRHNPFGGVIENGVLYGRGAVDMKSAIAAFAAAAARHLAQGLLKGSIALLITGDEEGDAVNGTQKVLGWLKEKGIRLSDCIVGEPSSIARVGDQLKIGRRGSVNVTAVVEGAQGHAAYPAKAINPIPVLAELVCRLSNSKLDHGTALFEPSTLAFSSVDVGNPATNVIPAKAVGAFNIRFNDTWTPDSLKQHLEAVAAAGTGDCRISLRYSFSGVAFATPPGPFTELVARAVVGVTGATPQYSTGGGTSDARFIKDYCPVVELGLVNATMHKANECVPVADIARLSDIYAAILADYFES